MSENQPQAVLILGATSGIARALAHAYAARGATLLLAARQREAIEQDAADLRVRYKAKVQPLVFDATDPATFEAVLSSGQIDVAVLCHGVMISNEAAHDDPDAHRRMIQVNYTSCALLLEKLADKMLKQGGGVIGVVSSVAGDRGRGSNYCYGATKAALSAYADGLRGRLHDSAVHILTIKPGPTATPMTAGMPDQSRMASPELVAKQIVRAIDKRKDVLYTPGKWRLIMAVIRAIPEFIFKKLSI